MLILLPPSEGKSEGSGPALKPKSLHLAASLGAARTQVMDALIKVSAGPKSKALQTLGLTPSMTPLLERNATLLKNPAAPAMEIYSGVLFEALDWKSLTAKAKNRGEDSILISSALFGVLRPNDHIPAYRLSMDVKLPKVGALASFWRGRLASALTNAEDRLILDARSSTYAASWAAPSEITYGVSVVEIKAGKRKIVSHMAKHSRGVLTRMLLSAPRPAKNIDEVAEIASTQFEVEIAEPQGKKTGVLTLIIRG